MLQRCRDLEDERYGGRGIRVCERWQSFENFLADMGERPPGMQIERKDNSGHYEPGNCLWATHKTQARNRRTSRHIEINGVVKTVAEWAELKGVPYNRLSERLERGWPIQHLFDPPSVHHSRAKNQRAYL